MTKIEDEFTEFTMVESLDGRDDSTSTVSPLTPESTHPQHVQQQVNETADDQSSNLAYGGSDLPEIIPQAEDDESTDYFKIPKSLYKKIPKWGNKDVLIAVMGMTGSGKTTFISKVTGRTDLKIGHGLTSCTQEIQVAETVLGGRVVRFVDTPGFSDTYLSDTEVLEMIADYLAAAYSKDMRLSGLIYLHPISENRVTHHATKNLEMFRKLTGNENLKNVILTASMWDKVSPEERERRETELQNKFWKLTLMLGAKYIRYDGSVQSAKNIALKLVGNTPFYLKLQEEMGGDHKALRDTAAGKEIMAEIAQMKEQHQKELTDMKEMMLRTAAEENRVVTTALEEHYKEMLRSMERTLADERRMNEDAVKSLTERINALENKGFCAVM
ncbi:hypothetical protein M426DRAFT_316001 [Hypoxylon sp. CI-4A]|nr:hypothetical protein M426DRAFT_316001 [Hypoxylon sp. CI-4A]